jgi:hypothetical protein
MNNVEIKNERALTESPIKKSTELTNDEKDIREFIRLALQQSDNSYYKIGKRILEFYDSNTRGVFNPNSKKGQTLRKIVDSLDREISLTQLHRMVRVTKQDKFFEEQGVDVSQASFSQKAELVSIPDNDKKIELMKDAMTKEWSVKDLREGVEKAKGKTGKGKSAKASAIKNSKLLQQLIAKEADMTDLKGTEQEE